jgi:uncharacterized protein YjbJ (UPF0337 family)
MNADQLKGKWTQFKGELGGNYEKFIGKVQERYGDKKSELMKWADTWHQKLEARAAEKK